MTSACHHLLLKRSKVTLLTQTRSTILHVIDNEVIQLSTYCACVHGAMSRDRSCARPCGLACDACRGILFGANSSCSRDNATAPHRRESPECPFVPTVEPAVDRTASTL